MSELYTSTLKYFYLAIAEFLPLLEEMKEKPFDKQTKEETMDMFEAYEDIISKISKYNLNYTDPNRGYEGEPDKIDIDIPDIMVEKLARLSHRLLLTWKENQERLKQKEYLTDKNKTELYKLENLIWPLEALLKEKSYVVGKYAHLGPLKFPWEEVSDLEQNEGIVGVCTRFLDEIEKSYTLAKQEILDRSKIEDLEVRMKSSLGEVVEEINDEPIKLKYQKLNSGLTLQLKSGFHNLNTAESRLERWKNFMEEIVRSFLDTKPRAESYFSPGHPYDAVKELREILKSAKTKIWIADNFLHPETLQVVEPYIKDKTEIKFLTKNNGKNFSSFCVDYKKLKIQYPNSFVETKENTLCHDRYIIVDEKEIYHLGHSLHDLGKKASQINKVENKLNKDKILNDFKNWWDTGTVVD